MVYITRFWELDFLRGIAIIMMAIFHLLFDLYYFGGYSIDVNSGFWLIFARATAFIFLFLIGICLSISYSKRPNRIWLKNLKRGLKVFGFGLIITAVTFLAFGGGFIVFGVLHFIGISVILSSVFLRFGKLNILFTLVFLLFGFYIQGFIFDFPWLLWLGLQPTGFYTFDYFPIFPWFGVILLGVFFGGVFYKNGNRMFRIMDLGRHNTTKVFNFLGKHSLIAYLLHQPIIVLILYLLGLIHF